MSDVLHELVAKVDGAVAAAQTHHTFEEARAALNESRIHKARTTLWESVDRIEATQASVRQAQDAARRSKEKLDAAIAEAEWLLDGRFVNEGNKWFLVEPCLDDDHEDGCTGTKRRQLTADERRDWKAREALKTPGVVAATNDLRVDEQNLQAARDALVVAEKFNQAARSDLDAAIATVTTLAASIRKENP